MVHGRYLLTFSFLFLLYFGWFWGDFPPRNYIFVLGDSRNEHTSFMRMADRIFGGFFFEMCCCRRYTRLDNPFFRQTKNFCSPERTQKFLWSFVNMSLCLKNPYVHHLHFYLEKSDFWLKWLLDSIMTSYLFTYFLADSSQFRWTDSIPRLVWMNYYLNSNLVTIKRGSFWSVSVCRITLN